MSLSRFEQKRRAERWRRIRRWCWGAAGVVLVALLVWVVGWSNVLAVRSVDVRGVTSLDEQDVKAAAAVPLGEPLIRVDTGRIEQRVEALRRVESVEVSRRWPRTLRLEVVERSAVAWTDVNGAITAIDRTGFVFRTYKKAPDGLVELKVTDVGADDLADVRAEVAAAITAVRDADPDLWAKITLVEATSRDAIDFRLTKGRLVHWGSAARTADKLRVLDALLDIDAREYDVSAPDQPTTRA